MSYLLGIPPVVVSGIQGSVYTEQSSYEELGGLVFDPTEHAGKTLSFDVLIQTTAGNTVTVQLYNRSLGAEVVTSILTSIQTAAESKSVTLVAGVDLPNALQVYSVRLKITTAAAGEVGICKMARLEAS